MKKRSIVVFSSVYFGIIILVVLYSFLKQTLSVDFVGIRLFSVGLAISVISFVTLNQYGGQGSTSFVRVMRTDEEYKKWRSDNKPYKDVILAVVLANLLTAATGIVLLSIG